MWHDPVFLRCLHGFVMYVIRHHVFIDPSRLADWCAGWVTA